MNLKDEASVSLGAPRSESKSPRYDLRTKHSVVAFVGSLPQWALKP